MAGRGGLSRLARPGHLGSSPSPPKHGVSAARGGFSIAKAYGAAPPPPPPPVSREHAKSPPPPPPPSLPASQSSMAAAPPPPPPPTSTAPNYRANSPPQKPQSQPTSRRPSGADPASAAAADSDAMDDLKRLIKATEAQIATFKECNEDIVDELQDNQVKIDVMEADISKWRASKNQDDTRGQEARQRAQHAKDEIGRLHQKQLELTQALQDAQQRLITLQQNSKVQAAAAEEQFMYASMKFDAQERNLLMELVDLEAKVASSNQILKQWRQQEAEVQEFEVEVRDMRRSVQLMSGRDGINGIKQPLAEARQGLQRWERELERLHAEKQRLDEEHINVSAQRNVLRQQLKSMGMADEELDALLVEKSEADALLDDLWTAPLADLEEGDSAVGSDAMEPTAASPPNARSPPSQHAQGRSTSPDWNADTALVPARAQTEKKPKSTSIKRGSYFGAYSPVQMAKQQAALQRRDQSAQAAPVAAIPRKAPNSVPRHAKFAVAPGTSGELAPESNPDEGEDDTIDVAAVQHLLLTDGKDESFAPLTQRAPTGNTVGAPLWDNGPVEYQLAQPQRGKPAPHEPRHTQSRATAAGRQPSPERTPQRGRADPKATGWLSSLRDRGKSAPPPASRGVPKSAAAAAAAATAASATNGTRAKSPPASDAQWKQARVFSRQLRQ